MADAMRRIFVLIRALLRVLGARWRTRRFVHGRVLHFVPLDVSVGRSRPATVRPALCGARFKVDEATIQTNIVGCWPCAVAIEEDRRRWEPKRYRRLRTEGDVTWCETCGHVIQMFDDDISNRCACAVRTK